MKRFIPKLERLEGRIVPYNFNEYAAPILAQYAPAHNVYEAFEALGRSPSTLELQVLTHGDDRQIFAAVAASGEYRAKFGTTELYVAGLFHDFLGRQASPAEVTAWTQRINAVGIGASGEIVNSPEAFMKYARSQYQDDLNRSASNQEASLYASATSRNQIDLSILGSAEFYSYHPNSPNIPGHQYDWYIAFYDVYAKPYRLGPMTINVVTYPGGYSYVYVTASPYYLAH